MASGIFLINNDDELIELEESSFDNEDIFQELLENYPNLLSGKLINPEEPRSWLLVDREVGIPGEKEGSNRWSIDHLFLDQDGMPTLVEVKRSSDTRLRREVVGQMLVYAANSITYWPVEQIISVFENRCEKKDIDPTQLLNNLFDTDYKSYWDRVKTNLTAGKVRMIFLADDIPSELKRIVEFLNEQMDPAVVLALEIKQFKANGLQTLVPTLYGNTSEADKRKSSSYNRKKWNEEKFLKDVEERLEADEVEKIRSLYSWAQKKGSHISWGTGAQRGSYNPKFDHISQKSVFTVYSDGTLQLNFGWLDKPEASAKYAKKLGKRLKEEIKVFSIPSSFTNEHITIPLEKWAPHLTEFTNVLEEVLFQDLSSGN